MRFSVLAYATVAAGLGVTVAGGLAAAGKPLTALALFGAAALAAELLEEPENARVREPLGSGVFRVASGVDLAAVMVLGPWRGALVAGSAALLARIVRGPWRQGAFQAASYALASLAAGYAFSIGGGHFGVVLSQADSRDAERLFERFQSALRDRPLPEIGIVSFSGGVAELLPNDDATALIVRTDAALGLAKSSGRDMVVTAAKRPHRDVA